MEFVFEKVDDFHNYIIEDKSKYKTATEAGYIDPDNDFLIGESGGFLMNIDFKFINTDLFSEVANYKVKHRTYIKDKIDSIPHKKFRKREENRRLNGYTQPCKLNKDGSITNLRITGEHYNFLNYVEILRLEIQTTGANNTGIKKKGFPRFFDSQYWWFKVKEFSRANGFNLLTCKTRRAGFSYMEGKGAANTINLIPDKSVLLAAWDKAYLTKSGGISDMALKQIEYYETQTPFKRGLLSREPTDIKLGFKDRQKIDKGFLSNIISVSTFNNPDAAIGKDATEIKCEERGKFPNFDEFMTQTEPTIRTGSYVTGQVIAYGTVNASSETADAFEYDFRNPSKWHFMPFENVWDRNKRDDVCGFYKPFWWGLEGEIDGMVAMDIYGNTDYNIAIRIVEREHRDKYENAETIKDYIDFKGQYGNTPADSFAASGSNMFTSDELELHYKAVKNTNEFKFYRDGILEEFNNNETNDIDVVFRSHDWLMSQGRQKEIHEYIIRLKPDPKLDNLGCIRQFFPPIRINNAIPENLYRIYVDPFGVDKDDNKNVTRDNSFASVRVYMVANNITNGQGDMLVASYVGRPLKQESLSRLVLKLSKYYNAKVFTENDRGQIIQDFRHWKETNRLVKEPNFSWDVKLQGGKGREFGISMGSGHSNRRLKGLELLYEYLYTVRETINGVPKYNFHYIYDEGYLNELLRFNLTGNFDRISAAIVEIYDMKEMLYSNLEVKKPEYNDPFKPKQHIFERSWY